MPVGACPTWSRTAFSCVVHLGAGPAFLVGLAETGPARLEYCSRPIKAFWAIPRLPREVGQSKGFG